ncbi:MAG: DUF1343 domain-containing protein [Sulfolobales archaeon]
MASDWLEVYKLLLGVDVFLSEDLWRRYSDKRIAVMTNISGVTSDLSYTVEELMRRGLRVEGVISAEHGFWTTATAGEIVEHYNDDYLGRPVYSLYRADLSSVRDFLRDIDVVIIDMQDLGLRYYTYISAVIDLIDLASEIGGLEIVILDRPNPLGGVVVEGGLPKERFYSYVSRYSIPIRYGATLGEISMLYSYENKRDVDVKVIPVRGWRRDLDILDLEFQWVPPSPAIPTPDTVYSYAITVYLEPTNISEGRGTYTPFKVLGAPFIDPKRLADELNKRTDSSVIRFRPAKFKPSFSKYAGEICGGVFIHVIDRRKLRTVETGLVILRTLYELYNDKIVFYRSGDMYGIDRLFGDDKARSVIVGELSIEEYLREVEEEIANFIERIDHFKIYR